MIELVGLTGRARAGKDSVAQFFAEAMGANKVALLRFARFKRGLADALAVDDWEARDADQPPGLKEALIPHLGVSWRQLCQQFGTDFARTLCGEDVWPSIGLKTAERLLGGPPIVAPVEGPGARAKLVKPTCVLFTDCRFINEARLIREAGGLVVRVSRPNNPHAVNAHRSEQEMDSREFARYVTHNIPNTGTLEDLRKYARGLAKVVRE